MPPGRPETSLVQALDTSAAAEEARGGSPLCILSLSPRSTMFARLLIGALLTVATALPLGARTESRCTVMHDALSDLVNGRRTPRLEVAMIIVGDELPPVQVR